MGKYVVLKSDPLEFDTRSDDNHIFIHTKANGTDYSLAVNIQSNVKISRLYYCIKTYRIEEDDCASGSKIVKWLRKWIHAEKRPYTFEDETDGIRIGVHYEDGWIRDEDMLPAEDELTFLSRNPQSMIDLDKNVLAANLVELIQKVITQKDGFLVTAGVMWGPKEERDWTFGFYPAKGLHDIHKNDSAPDGAIFFYSLKEQIVTGIFTKFIRNI